VEKLIVQGVDITDLLGMPYEAGRHPGNTSVDEFLADPSGGANCQLFALGVLRKAGFSIDDKMPMDQGERFGSKEFWLDTRYTKLVTGGWRFLQARQSMRRLLFGGKLRVFDIYFFLPPGIDLRGENPDTDEDLFKKFHIAIFTGFDFDGREDFSNLSRVFFHNAKPGPSAVWSMRDFEEKGYTLFGVKRPIRKIRKAI
jgi:hypothetical protein